MDIRDLAAHELPELLALYRHLHAADDPLPPRDVIEAVWQELQGSKRCRYFGGYVDERMIASCALTIIPNLTRACRPYGVIENVVTHAQHRNRGHGKALLSHALSVAWSQGCYKVMLMTGRKDDATFRFYESAGFDPHDKQAFIAKRGAAT